MFATLAIIALVIYSLVTSISTAYYKWKAKVITADRDRWVSAYEERVYELIDQIKKNNILWLSITGKTKNQDSTKN